MKVILYSNHCPQCLRLEALLKQKGITYEEVNDVDLMIGMGFRSMPMLDVDGEVMKFADALKWLEKQHT